MAANPVAYRREILEEVALFLRCRGWDVEALAKKSNDLGMMAVAGALFHYSDRVMDDDMSIAKEAA